MTILSRSKLICILAVVAVANFGACGGESDQEKASGLVLSLLEGDPATCDDLTADFLESVGGSVRECRRDIRSVGELEGKVEIERVSVRGSRATVTATRGNESAPIMLVKRDGNWMVSGVGPTESERRQQAATQPQIQNDLSPLEAADAYFRAIRDGDERAFCGLITPREALEVIGADSSDEPLRDCVEALSDYDWRKDSRRARGVTTEAVKVRGDTAVVRLSRGKRARLEQYLERWVVDDISK
jgi:hypothetical protein